MDIITVIGASGAFIILVAFILLEIEKLSSESMWYDMLNLIGGALLAYYAWLLRSWPFLTLNGIWTLTALRDVFRDYSMKRTKKIL
ncbi:MAG TPA: hypothetical protein VJL32_01545 [Candidatus Paceibacterota bacterium]